MTILPVFVSFSLLLASLGWPVRHQAGGAFARGERLARDNKYQEAVEAYTEAVRLDPHDYKAFLGRAAAYNSLKEPALAHEDLDRAVQAAPSSDEPLFARAVDRYFDDHYAEAITDLDAAIHLNPGHFELYHWRACAHANLGHNELAVADFTQVIERDPEKSAFNGLDYANRAAAERQLGRPEAALADYEKAEAAGQSSPVLHGECLLDLKRYQEALAIFDEVLRPLGDEPEQNGEFYQAVYDRAMARTWLKLFDGAKADLAAYIAVKPDDARTYGNVAWALLLANHAAEARVAALQGLALDGTQDWIRINLADAYLVEGKLDQARAIYLEEKDKVVEGKTGAQAAREDLRDLRAAGIDVPGMAAIEALLPKTSDAPPTPAVPTPPAAATVHHSSPE